jgi:hypothetical protein
LRNKKIKKGSAENCLPSCSIIAVSAGLRELKKPGNAQNHTIHSECVEESVELIQRTLESKVKSEIHIPLGVVKKVNGVVQQAISEVVNKHTPKRHPPASLLKNASSPKKQKSLQYDDNEWPLLRPFGRAK